MKFEVYQSENNQKHYFRLKAKNGEVILSSQGYAEKAGCAKGVESVKKNALEDARFDRKESENGKFYFTLKAGNNQVIGKSQMYSSKAAMEKGIESVKNVAPKAEIVPV